MIRSKVSSAGPVAGTLRSQCRGLGLIPGRGTRSHVLQLRVCVPQLKTPCALPQQRQEILYATTKTQHSEINKQIFFKASFKNVIILL